MKKVIALASVLALSACAVVGLAACEEEAAHTHTYGSWTVEKAATLFEDGLQSRVCTADDCDADDQGREEQAIPALGKTSAVKDAFTVYNSGLTATENGVRLGMSEADGCGASPYLGETDKVFAFDGENETTLSFTLDVSAFETGDFTTFSLAFGVEDSEDAEGNPVSGYVTENIFGIRKTENGYTLAVLHGINWSDTASMGDAIEAAAENEKTAVTDEDGVITFSYRYSYADGELASALLVNGEKTFDFAIYNPKNKPMKGARYLWNCTASTDEVVLSDLVLA